MGSCVSVKKAIRLDPSQFVHYSYLDRRGNALYKFTSVETDCFVIRPPVKLREDSAIGLLGSSQILVGGGTDSTGCLTCTCYVIDTATNSVQKLPKLPLPVKEGTFYQVEADYVFVGGIVNLHREELALEDSPSPIARFSPRTSQWHYWNIEEDVGQYRIFGGCSFTLDTLLYAGTAQIGNTLYFIGGGFINAFGELIPNTRILSLDVVQGVVSSEQVQLPAPRYKPLSLAVDTRLLVLGGFDPDTGHADSRCLLLQPTHPSPVRSIKPLPLVLTGNYPLQLLSHSVLVFSYPLYCVCIGPDWTLASVPDTCASYALEFISNQDVASVQSRIVVNAAKPTQRTMSHHFTVSGTDSAQLPDIILNSESLFVAEEEEKERENSCGDFSFGPQDSEDNLVECPSLCSARFQSNPDILC